MHLHFTSPIPPLSSSFSFQLHLLWLFFNTHWIHEWCLCVHEYKAIYWVCVTSQSHIPVEDSSPSSNHQLPVAPLIGLGLHDPLPCPWCYFGQSCEWTSRLNEFMYTTVLLCPANTVSQQTSTPGSPSGMMHETWGEDGLELSTRQWLIVCSWTCGDLCINQHVLQKKKLLQWDLRDTLTYRWRLELRVQFNTMSI